MLKFTNSQVSKESAMKEYGGYTAVSINGFEHTFVLDKTLKVGFNPFKNTLIVGYGFDKNGEKLPFKNTDIYDFIKPFEPLEFRIGEGAYIMNNGSIVVEPCFLLSFTGKKAFELGTISEKIRNLFNQESVLFVDQSYTGHFVK